jgi:hypothetical protein
MRSVPWILFLFLIPLCSADSYPLIGFCWVSNPFSDMTLHDEGFRAAHHMGCQIEHRQYNWKEIEPDNTVYDWNALDQWYRSCTTYSIVPSLAVCPLNSNSGSPSFPQDLEGRPFDDSEVVLRLQKLTRLLLERYPEIRYVSFGNEINYYLRVHWNEYPSYLRMCQLMYQYTKEHFPHLGVLVIFGFTGMEKREEELIQQVLPACDIVGISTYHASVSTEMIFPRLTEEEMREGIEYCITLCSGKRVALVETAAFSYPDPDYQATYVHVFFEIIREHADDMEFACWFGTYDWCPGMLTMLDPFLEQFNSTGLLTPDGSPKASYYAWMEEMSYHGVDEPPRVLAALSVILLGYVLLRQR